MLQNHCLGKAPVLSCQSPDYGPVLPDGFTPVSIQSQLPARLEPDGNLRVQVRPGRWQITLVARADDVTRDRYMLIERDGLTATDISLL